MSLNVNILPVFEQLGLYDELMAVSFTSPGMHVYNENMEKIGFRGNEGIKEMYALTNVDYKKKKK